MLTPNLIFFVATLQMWNMCCNVTCILVSYLYLMENAFQIIHYIFAPGVTRAGCPEHPNCLRAIYSSACASCGVGFSWTSTIIDQYWWNIKYFHGLGVIILYLIFQNFFLNLMSYNFSNNIILFIAILPYVISYRVW
jgi:hypothetical protein